MLVTTVMDPTNWETDRIGGRRVGLLYDDRMCKHQTPDGKPHPENPNRIKVIWEKLKSSGISERCVILDAKEAKDKNLFLVHDKEHVNLIKTVNSQASKRHRKRTAAKLDSIYLNEGSSESAYLAAGSVMEAAERVAAGDLSSAFAVIRPPGHHAEPDKAMGFCIFNNVAVAARYIVDEKPELGINKILIVDWDVHHGNGTQKMFWKDPRVLVFSVHRHESGSFYPANDDGNYTMIGEGDGAGYNINVPWENALCGDADYLAVWDHILIPVAKEFNPDMVIISAGFDAAMGDPLGDCRVTPNGYSAMLRKLMDCAQGKMVLALEGGYNLTSIANSALACVETLLGVGDGPIISSTEASPFESTWTVIKAVRNELKMFWQALADEVSALVTTQTVPPSEDEEMLEPFIQPVASLNVGADNGEAMAIDHVDNPGSERVFPSETMMLIDDAPARPGPSFPGPSSLEDTSSSAPLGGGTGEAYAAVPLQQVLLHTPTAGGSDEVGGGPSSSRKKFVSFPLEWLTQNPPPNYEASVPWVQGQATAGEPIDGNEGSAQVDTGLFLLNAAIPPADRVIPQTRRELVEGHLRTFLHERVKDLTNFQHGAALTMALLEESEQHQRWATRVQQKLNQLERDRPSAEDVAQVRNRLVATLNKNANLEMALKAETASLSAVAIEKEAQAQAKEVAIKERDALILEKGAMNDAHKAAIDAKDAAMVAKDAEIERLRGLLDEAQQRSGALSAQVSTLEASLLAEIRRGETAVEQAKAKAVKEYKASSAYGREAMEFLRMQTIGRVIRRIRKIQPDFPIEQVPSFVAFLKKEAAEVKAATAAAAQVALGDVTAPVIGEDAAATGVTEGAVAA